MAYLRGEKEFFGRPFEVDSRVLVPRPETEHLVEAVLDLRPGGLPRILDLGTGSGCLAVTLALEIPEARVVGIDRSPGALAVARRNVRRHGVERRVGLALSHWTEALDLQTWSVVVTNPPYIDPGDRSAYAPEVARHEPAGALFAGRTGLEAYRELFDRLRRLPPGVEMIGEIGRGQLPALREVALPCGWHAAEIREDLAGIPRVVRWRRDEANPDPTRRVLDG